MAQRDTFRVWRAIILLLRVKCFGPVRVKPRIVSEEVKQPIINWYLERRTVTEYSDLSGRPLKVVKSIIKKYIETGNVQDQHKCGRKGNN